MRGSNIIGKGLILIRVKFLLLKVKSRGKKVIKLALKYAQAKLFSKVT
jgi:hypothetical protein